MSTLSERIQPALQLRDSSLEQSALLDKSFLDSLPVDSTSIPRACGLLTEKELDLTENYDATGLLGLLAAREVSAQELLAAYRKRATIAHQCTNCLTELLPEALADAKARDEYLSKTGKTIGPLHGLPISVKEQLGLGGKYTNTGFVAWVDRITPEDAAFVKSLKDLGAVIFARTNQPQSLMAPECSNNIYGTTVHPMNRALTPGGSTGGEAALMGMKASPMGMGGDIGGSIRIPAGLTGLYGLLPCPGRISAVGSMFPVHAGCDSILPSQGPLARSLRDIELFCTAYSSCQPWINDPTLIPCDILNPSLGRQPIPGKPLRVGVLTYDGVAAPLPPVRRVIEQVRDKLGNSSGIEVVPFEPYDHARGWSIITANFFEEDGDDIRRKCAEGGEPVLPLTDWIIDQVAANEKVVGKTVQDRKVARDEFRQEYRAHWNKSGVDVVVAPVTAGCAPVQGTSKYWGYTCIWNLLSHASIALPGAALIGEANSVEDLSKEVYEPKNDIEAHLFKHYSPKTSAGLPVGIQVVAPRFNESLAMKAAYIVEAALKA